MTQYNRAQLKQAARRALKVQRPRPMLITLLYVILINVFSQVVGRILGAATGGSSLGATYVQMLYQYQDPTQVIQYILLSFGPSRIALALLGMILGSVAASLWTGLVNVGYRGFCLGAVRGRQPQTGALFSAFPRFGPVLLTQILAGLFQFLWVLLFGVAECILLVAAVFLFGQVEALMILIVLASYAALLVGVLWATLRYAMVDFLIADQGLTGMDAIRESKRLMKGNIRRLFVLNLSFIGWYLLEYAILLVALIVGVAAFGGSFLIDYINAERFAVSLLGFLGSVSIAAIAIAVFNLWLTPYITGSTALLYDYLRGGSIPTPGSGFGGPEGWGRPDPQSYDYTWSSGPSSGTGIGPAPRDGGPGPQEDGPKSPKDDPWN